MATGRRISRTMLAVVLCLVLAACSEPAQRPPYAELVRLTGTPYERGLQHGRRFADKIRSLYSLFFTSSLLPWLNREQPDVESILTEYQKPLYDNGQFSYQVLLQSGQNLLQYMPEPYREEMRGISDGSGVPFDQVLVLNTFVDTLFSLRSILFLIREAQAPRLLSVEFVGEVGADGLDNDDDGEIDEPGEGRLDPYAPLPYAAMVEVPADAKIRLLLKDPQGVDPGTIRIQLDEKLFEPGNGSIATRQPDGDPTMLEITFEAPGGLPPASTVALILQGGDFSDITDPPPDHARFMRDERIVFTTRGAGLRPYEVPNQGLNDGRTQPPSIGFAVRGSATADGRLLVAHHLSLLDNNASHKHTVLFLHEPAEGKPHVVLGWTGIVWGFSGMNADGVVCAGDISDTLDNTVVSEFLQKLVWAKVLSSGVPMGVLVREVLAHSSNVGEALEFLKGTQKTFGQNLLLADRSGSMAVAEVDSNIRNEPEKGFYPYTPDTSDPANLDAWGRPWASVGPDDLRMASHYQRNWRDIDLAISGLTLIPPQRTWTTYYFRSLRAFFLLGDEIAARYGALDVPGLIDILRIPDIIDQRDSMNAAIYEPESLTMRYAMGEVPASDGPFRSFDLGAALAEKRSP